jgi:nucleoside-diphosphate-sugar epimerase
MSVLNAKITVLGENGFINSHVIKKLNELSITHDILETRKTDYRFKHLGTVIYAIGVNYDFREKMFDMIDAEITTLVNLIRWSKIDKIIYISSKRVEFKKQLDSYNLTKLLAEEIIKNSGIDHSILRIGNVSGDNMPPPKLKIPSDQCTPINDIVIDIISKL